MNTEYIFGDVSEISESDFCALREQYDSYYTMVTW